MIYKYCRRCGKRLKGEENRARGFGPVCFEKTKREQSRGVLVPSQLTLFAEVDQAESRAEMHARKGRAESRKRNSKKESKGRPPHLEKTLTPTYKMGLLFTPPIPTPTPRREHRGGEGE
jgi:hypothetical protein